MSNQPRTLTSSDMSPYLYCAGNPVKFVDPDGLWYWDKSGTAPMNSNFAVDVTKIMIPKI